MSKEGIKATPLNYQLIEMIAVEIRNRLKISGKFPADKLELILSILYDDKCTFSVREDIKEEGTTSLDGSFVSLRMDVYDDLLSHKPRARFTAVHELSHRILHCDKFSNIVCCKTEEIEIYCNPEWQADALAGAILCPASEIIKYNMDEYKIMNRYGVSENCAKKRLSIIKSKIK
jgi:Zn-dependent peptidase ImmA (M78 family)